MPFSQQGQGNDQLFDNADSFAMAFDAAWKHQEHLVKKTDLGKDERLREVLKDLKDHPFMKNSPSQANQVAKFRIKLLKLI